MAKASRLQITMRPIASLKPDPRNARTHSEKQIALIAKSIEEFGFINPIIVDEAGSIMAGHARHKAAVFMGLKEAVGVEPRLADTGETFNEVAARRLSNKEAA